MKHAHPTAAIVAAADHIDKKKPIFRSMKKPLNCNIFKRSFLVILLIAPLLSMTRQQEIKWVAIGDSITYLNDHLNETRNRVTRGYLTRVTEQLPYIHYVNQGHNGWTTVGIAKEIDKIGLVKADLYSVFLGTNDWWSALPAGTINDYEKDTGIATTAGAYRKIINKLRSLNDKARIVLITPMQRGDFVYIGNAKNNAYGSYQDKNKQSLEDFVKVIAAIGKLEHFPVVDLYHQKSLSVKKAVKFKRLKDPVTGAYKNYKYPRWVGVPFQPSDEYPYPPAAVDMTYDGLHPSDKGNAVIAKQIVKVFRQN